MNVNDFIHPEDKEALEQLNAVPFVSTFFKYVMKFYDEQINYGLNMANKIRLSPKQLPHIYNLLPPIVNMLGIPEPELYLEMTPLPNAYAMGETRTTITLTSGLLDLMSEDELKAVIAHECGHILCHHMLYMTMIYSIMDHSHAIPEVMNTAVIALRYWNRKSELSCDRVASYVTSPAITTSMLSKFAGGSNDMMYDFNLEEFAKQVDIYESIRTKDFWNKTLQAQATLFADHPFISVRVRELLKWTRSEEFIHLLANIPICPNCKKPINSDWAFCKYCGAILK